MLKRIFGGRGAAGNNEEAARDALQTGARADGHGALPEVQGIRLADASRPAPFGSGLEYSSPARGTWNIVHMGMLVPGAHEIFVCATCCLRGVVLTAAEMDAMDRFSTVTIKEHNLLDGDMEDLVIEGVSEIIEKLPVRPPAVMVYTSCVHHFTGVDLDMIYKRLAERWPDIDFVDCYMNPIMRKSGLTPDQLMRSRIYKLLKPRQINPRAVCVIGSDVQTDADSDLMRMLRAAGCKVHEIHACRTYDEFQEMAESALYISYYSDAEAGAQMVADRLGARHFALPFSWDYEEIEESLYALAGAITETCSDAMYEAGDAEECMMAIERFLADIPDRKRICDEMLKRTRRLVGDTPIAIDYTYAPRPLGLAKLLLDSGFNVQKVYLDAVSGADSEAFDYLKEKYPELRLCPTVHPAMRFASSTAAAEGTWDSADNRWLTIGQKAAYFIGTNHFVNVIEGGGMIGYEAITRTAGLIADAYENEKDMKSLVQFKGLGSEKICGAETCGADGRCDHE